MPFQVLMRRTGLIYSMKLIMIPASAQPSFTEKKLLQELDSASRASAPAKYFASIYLTTTEKAIRYYAADTSAQKQLILRFEDRFAGLYFSSAGNFIHHQPVADAWKNYYRDSLMPPVKYMLYGINAHINGDIWQALQQSFSYDELKTVRPAYDGFYQGLLLEYNEFYRAAYRASRTIRHLHLLTLGADKLYGRLLLKRWRKRQMKLALTYYTDNNKFGYKLAKLKRKKERIDRLIGRHI